MYYFFGFSAIRAEFILDYWNKSDDFWDSLRSSRSSQSSESVSMWSLQNLHDHPDRPRELNSIQAIEVVSVVRVVCDRLGSVSIWSSRSSEHFLRRLGRSGRSYETRLNVGNDDYIVLCNFDGLIISGLEAEEGRGLRTSPRPFTVAGSKKLTGLNFLFPSPIHTIWNRIPRSTGSPSQLCKRIEILISDWLVMEIFSIHFEIKCENFFICNACVWHLVPSYRCPIVDYSEVLPWFVQLCRVTRLQKG